MVTIQELSKQCGVSVSTVSKALNGYADISERTKKKVLNAAKELGYYPNSNARALKLKKTYNIGVLFQTQLPMGFRNDYFAYVFSAFREAASKKGYDITFIEQNIGKQNMSFLEHSMYRNFDGVCIINTRYNESEIGSLLEADIPRITIDYPDNNIASITSDNYHGMCNLMQYIIDCGHTRIGYIHGEDCYVSALRKKAYIDTLRRNHIPFHTEYLVEGVYRKIEDAEQKSNQLLSLEELPTCIIAPDDHSATGVANAIYKSKIGIDISVAGFDGLYPCYVLGKRLTTIQQKTEEIGEMAANKLIAQIENEAGELMQTQVISCNLIAGESVSKLK